MRSRRRASSLRSDRAPVRRSRRSRWPCSAKRWRRSSVRRSALSGTRRPCTPRPSTKSSAPSLSPALDVPSTFSLCAALMSGPIVTPGSLPLPTLTLLAASTSARAALRVRPRRRRRRRSSRGTAAPRNRTRCRSTFAIDFSQSQSSITTVKFFAPPSACARFPVAPRARRRAARPGRADERDARDVLVLEDAVHDVFAAVDRVHDPLREPECRSSSKRRCCEKGTCSLGLTTIVLPVAIA
jgi:hypothetical protein